MELKKVCLFLLIFFSVWISAVNEGAILSKKPEKKLSDYELFEDAIAQIPNKNVYPYILHSALFSDYADKHRFVYVPKGKKAKFVPNEVYDFPVGSALVKTFSYPQALNGNRMLLETRLLLYQESGWMAHTYVWNKDQTEAYLKVTGHTHEAMTYFVDGEKKYIDYRVPNQNQCKECHLKSDVIMPIGPKSRNLNFSIQFQEKVANQISYWMEKEIVESHMPLDLIVNWSDEAAPLYAKARAYLDINCGHCHMPGGSADTTGLNLNLTETENRKIGIYKKPVAAGRASEGMKFSIVPGKPEESILLHRMDSLDPGVMMPESGRKLTHSEGVALINDWIISLK
jgi:uncharacterized repeat protein (TIGR03806 family)